MRRNLILLALPIFFCTGCSGMNHTGKGALVGGATGGLLGAGLGALTGNTGAGAAIGAGLGGIVGAGVGSDLDRDERHTKAAAAQAAANPPMTIQDVVYLVHNHTPEELIINQINTTHSNFLLTSTDITFLQSQGVSPRVISHMQARRAAPVRPVTYVERVYVHEPPPVSVGFGFYSGPRCRPPHHRRW